MIGRIQVISGNLMDQDMDGLCDYNYALKGRQIYNNQFVEYGDFDRFPRIGSFVRNVDRGLVLKKIQIMTVNRNLYSVQGYQYGQIVPGFKVIHDATDTGSCYVGRLIVANRRYDYTTFPRACGKDWTFSTDCSRHAVEDYAQALCDNNGLLCTRLEAELYNIAQNYR